MKGYHTFGLEWNAKTLNFYVDGILKGTRATPNDMHSEMYLLANLATQSTAKAPMSMSIDYIRAYSKDPNAVAVALDTVSAPDGKDPGLYGATSKVVAAETPVPTDLETLPVQAPPVPVNPTPAAPQPTTSPAVTPVPSPAAVAPPAASPSVTNPGLVLMGTDGADRLTGKAGDDVIHGGAGRDEIIGGAGADKLYGGDGDDVIRADADDTVIDGGAGRDILYVQGTKGLTLDLGKASIEEVIGGVGDDLLDGSRSTANLKLQGGEGDDTLIGGSGRDEIFGGAGADKLYGGDGDDVIRADADDTVIDGGAGRDILYVQGTKGLTLDLAKASIEEVVGGVGDDRLDGSRSTANLKLQGGEGDDTLIGGSGRDEIFGGADADKLYGGDGDDVIRADADDTVIDGGGGRDILYVQGTKGLTLDLAKASIEEVVGGAGDDRLDGSRSTANLKLQGGEGDDTLIGGSGRDEIRGGAGNDTLYGGLGSDILSGGAGDDLFVFNAPKAGNVANITDFEKGQDKLVVDLSAFGWSHAAGALPADAFFASETGRAADDHHRILYNAKTGDISYDADGSGAGKAIVFAHVDAKIQLAASDFQLMV
ncbi:hypothetical protein ASG43_07115 [Aureimonas sp. Leaf454]|nr:hypothetical protein ASG43_07115 [Aureimonas sp. Leaf454]